MNDDRLRREPGMTDEEWEAVLEARKREAERRMDQHDRRTKP